MKLFGGIKQVWEDYQNGRNMRIKASSQAQPHEQEAGASKADEDNRSKEDTNEECPEQEQEAITQEHPPTDDSKCRENDTSQKLAVQECPKREQEVVTQKHHPTDDSKLGENDTLREPSVQESPKHKQKAINQKRSYPEGWTYNERSEFPWRIIRIVQDEENWRGAWVLDVKDLWSLDWERVYQLKGTQWRLRTVPQAHWPFPKAEKTFAPRHGERDELREWLERP
ncbi:hypothetical protein F4777DRAFT_549835 [Nemania sp. FL0916]|nr:hypothetical protein F4777DRAFT_549835 [Nemania sp. FL0916]